LGIFKGRFEALFGSLIRKKFSMGTQIKRGEKGESPEVLLFSEFKLFFRDGIPNTMHNIDNNEMMVL